MTQDSTHIVLMPFKGMNNGPNIVVPKLDCVVIRSRKKIGFTFVTTKVNAIYPFLMSSKMQQGFLEPNVQILTHPSRLAEAKVPAS